MKKLDGLSGEVVEAAANETVRRLQHAIEMMKKVPKAA
jgi:hypothetical protein